MSEYHVGCGLFGIYGGRLNKKGEQWISKSDVTHEALSAVAQYLLQANKLFMFRYGGHTYELCVFEIDEKAAAEFGAVDL